MDTSRRFGVLAIALTFSAAAFANEAEDSEAVQALKTSLTSTAGFDVDDVRMGADGVACIRYRVSNDQGGTTKAMAVVDGDKVLRSTSRSRDFQNAWNSKCAGKG